MSLQQHTAERPVIRTFPGLESARAQAQPAAPAAHLTPRQTEVLSLLCEGLPNKLICRRLNISTGTVKVHISSILRELGVASRLQAVVSARRGGLLGEFVAPTPARAADPSASDRSPIAPGAPGYGALRRGNVALAGA